MNPGQGFTANAITSVLVIGASTLGLPVSTTHVSCGAQFGIGTVTRQAHCPTHSSCLGRHLADGRHGSSPHASLRRVMNHRSPAGPLAPSSDLSLQRQ
ncbi:MAG: inorganic phosphate transporter [bacterium]